ncbi:MAG: tetratricopeptide repeat protein [Proteobacteria bacterium]|nr:tetratricopeptide repeat protein [Pseudomonadota bacterium]
MQPAGEATVLADFADASFERDGVVHRFFRRGDAYRVRAPGADGEPAEFRVRYTFGVEPLQQYLVEGPGGRLQALDLAWDTRARELGGQRWFPSSPGPPPAPDGVMHWTGPGLRWNGRCAACHSTDVRLGYAPESGRYDTTWSEIDVACEACHGPGGAHVAWAEAGAAGDDPRLLRDFEPARASDWSMDPATGIARRRVPLASRAELDACAPCHSLRSPLREDFAGSAFLDAFRPALLEEGLYYADGQIQDEVYVYGSFLQSAMYRAGVTCGDCHDAHSLELRRPGDEVCAQCHDPGRFARESHHRHREDSPGADCLACHMPARTYMQVDPRRDHSFRVPRPDLGAELGIPDACTGCHADRGAEWAAARTGEWFGPRAHERPEFARALHAGRRRSAGSTAALLALSRDRRQPNIARATALALLADRPHSGLPAAVETGLAASDPLLRWGAALASQALPPDERLARLTPLLSDPVRLVRVEAARLLAPSAGVSLPAAQSRALDAALEEYRREQWAQSDQPAAHANLGALHADLGDFGRAEADYRRALRIGDYFLPAYAGLADLHRARGRDDRGEELLRRGLEIEPDSALLRYSLGLLLVRGGRLPEAVEQLRRAADLAPRDAYMAYVYGMALHSSGDAGRGLAVLADVQRRYPEERAPLLALATLHRDAGRTREAVRYARRLAALDPGDPLAARLRRELERRLESAGE